MKAAQVYVYKLKHVQGELLKFLWKFVYTLQNMLFFPLVLAIALFLCIFEDGNLFDLMAEYLDALSNGYETINKEVDKHSEEINALEAVGYTIAFSGLTYVVVSLFGIIGGAIVKSYFM